MTVAVVVLTYAQSPGSARAQYADTTVRALMKHLRWNGIIDAEHIRFHIADDGSYPGHVAHLTELAERMYHVTSTNAERGGYGHSFNLASQVVHPLADHFLMVEDDWELTRDLDLKPLVDAMDEDPGGINCIRLGYLGFTQELRGRVGYKADQKFLILDPTSPEPHVWAGHPRLEKKLFQMNIGAWPEGENAGQTEYMVAHRLESRIGVAWPLDLGVRASQHQGTLFAHIGAVQARTDQLEI